jgi:hypothetical protein
MRAAAMLWLTKFWVRSYNIERQTERPPACLV